MTYAAVIVLFINNSFEFSIFYAYHGSAQKSFLLSV